jgi:hypothetical protein
MGTGRKFNKKPVTRPKKKPRDRRRRERTHRKRLIALGVPEADVAKMNSKQLRERLAEAMRGAAAA